MKRERLFKSSAEVSKCDSKESLVTLPLSAMIKKNNYKPALMYAFLITK